MERTFKFLINGGIFSQGKKLSVEEEKALVDHLNKYTDEINHTINRKIQEIIINELNVEVKYTDVSIKYEYGSILLTGSIIIIIEWLGRLNTIMTFGEKCIRIIKKCIDLVQRQFVQPAIRADEYVSSINISQTQPYPPEQSNELQQQSQSSMLFSPQTILIVITLINIMIFLGGSVYTFFTVTSTRAQYQEATKIITEAKQKYQDTITTFSATELNFKAKADNLLNSMDSKSASISDSLDDKYKETKSKLDLLSKQTDLLTGEIEKKKQNISALNKNMNELQKKRFNVKPEDIWSFTDLATKIIVIVILVIPYGALFFVNKLNKR